MKLTHLHTQSQTVQSQEPHLQRSGTIDSCLISDPLAHQLCLLLKQPCSQFGSQYLVKINWKYVTTEEQELHVHISRQWTTCKVYQ